MPQGVELMPYGRVAFGLALAIVGCTSIFGYMVFLKATRQRQGLRKRSGLLRSLCASDLLMTFGHTLISSFVCFSSVWPFGDFGCQVHAFIAMTSSFVSIGNIVLLSRDIYARESGLAADSSSCGAYVFLNWILAIIGGSLPLIGIGAYGFETELRVGCVLDFERDRNMNLLYLSIVLVFWFVYPMYQIMNNYGKLDSKSKNLYLLKVVPIQMLIAWMPYGIMSFWAALHGPGFSPQIGLVMMLNVCIKSFFAMNPYIYIASDLELKKACWDVVLGSTDSEKLETKKKAS